MPIRGMTWRNGARIGSVISMRKRIGCSYGFGATQDRRARATMIKVSNWQKKYTKVRTISILSLAQLNRFLMAFNNGLG